MFSPSLTTMSLKRFDIVSLVKEWPGSFLDLEEGVTSCLKWNLTFFCLCNGFAFGLFHQLQIIHCGLSIVNTQMGLQHLALFFEDFIRTDL